MADSLLEKKHVATPRRRQQARQQGQVAVSGDLTSAALLLSAVAALWFFGGKIATHLATSVSESLSAPVMSGFDNATAAHWIVALAGKLAIAVVPILVLMMLAGVIMNLVQTGLILSPSRVTPQLSNVDPRAGLGRVFSLHSAARFGFGIFKIAVIIAVAYAAIGHYGFAIVGLSVMTAPQIAAVLFQSLMGTCLWIGGALFCLALLDYGFQRWKFEQDLMMTDEELRQEMKETAGDPQLIDRRREMARESKTRNIDTDIGNADLVIEDKAWTIALKYDANVMKAPMVTASYQGEDNRIKNAAHRNNIPVHELDLPSFESGSIASNRPIPHELFEVTASLFAMKD